MTPRTELIYIAGGAAYRINLYSGWRRVELIYIAGDTARRIYLTRMMPRGGREGYNSQNRILT